MEKSGILRFKPKTNNGQPQYYHSTEKGPPNDKGMSAKRIITTDYVEQAKIFISFGLAGLAAQQPEMNNKFEAMPYEQALMEEVVTLRLQRDLTSKATGKN